MAIRISGKLLDKYIAPGISGFTSAEIPDLTDKIPQADQWLVKCFQDSFFNASWNDVYRPIVIGLLRRATHACTSYNAARQLTIDYLRDNDPHCPHINRYYDAVSMWEMVAIDVVIALDLFRKRFNKGQGAFVKHDGSKYQRLYDIGNAVKHLDGRVESKQRTVDDTVPLWITSDGLNSFGLVVKYDEVAEVIVDLCDLADDLHDARAFKQKYGQRPTD